MRREQRNGRAVRERPVDVRQREANRTLGDLLDARPRLVVAGEAAEGQSRDVLVDIGRGDDRIEELRDTRNTLDIRAADRRIARSGALVDDDRYHTCYDQKAEEGDDDELVAPGH